MKNIFSKTAGLATAMAALLCGAAFAQTPPDARAEVAQLLATVENSKCQFNRNGTWYDSRSARKHLQDQFDYLDKRSMVPTAESFIEKGAARSSSSGKAYQIFCPGGKATPSTVWMMDELTKLRAAKPPAE